MNLHRTRLAWIFAISVTLFGASTVLSAQDEKPAVEAKADEKAPAEKPAETKNVVTTSAANSCLSDPIILDEIKKKQQEIEVKQKELQAKEAELKARETAMNDELKKLQETRDEIAKIEDTQRKANQEKVAKVIETLQTMSPKASAQLLTTLDDGLAVAAISQMDTAKLAKIMNLIDPKRGSKLTELLAGVVRAQHSTASSDVAVTTSKKGGNANDTTNNKPESIISGGPDLSAKSQQR